ncbi:MAG: glycosyltransferase, partial [Candidatus Limnocylindrales bacterium]
QAVPFELEILVASDGSIDATAAIVERLSGEDPRLRLLDLPATGTASAQNAIFEAAAGQIVVLTDAETRFAPGCLDALVAPFTDARVGGTTGRLALEFDEDTAAAHHEGLYWRYELLVRRLESRAGWLATSTGAVLAVRRSSYRRVASHAPMDQLMPLHVRDQGLRMLTIDEARAFDRGWTDLPDQFASRARIATRGIGANLSMATRLTPWRRPSAFLAIWSHKLLRWATPWLGAAAFAAALRLSVQGRRAYLVPVVAGVATWSMAAIGYAADSLGRPIRALALPLTFVTVNLAFVAGWVNLLRRRRIRSWSHPTPASAPIVEPPTDRAETEA